MNRLYYFLAIFLAMFSLAQSVKAEDKLTSVNLEILPHGSALAPFLNQEATGFRLNVYIDPSLSADSVQLKLDVCEAPIDSQILDNGGHYILSSGTKNNSELKILLEQCSGLTEGSHNISVITLDEQQATAIYQQELIADFTLEAPAGRFSADGALGQRYKIGESFNIIYEPRVNEPVEVTAYLFGRKINFIKTGEIYKYLYEIRDGDPELSGSMSLSQIKIIDLAGNSLEIGDELVAINFTTDSHPPTIDSTFEEKTYAETGLSIDLTIEGAEHISYFLNDQQISSSKLSKLTTGDYVFRVVATDGAGNIKERIFNFSIDLEAPDLAVETLPSELESSQPFKVTGQAEPHAKIKLYIDGQVWDTIADNEGRFSFETSSLASGSHKVIICVEDEFGNSKEIDLGSVTVKSKSGQISVSEPIKIAKAAQVDYVASRSASDIVQQPELEVAKSGKIIATTDSRNNDVRDYTPWYILLGLLVFSFAVSSAGYYGLTWLNSTRFADEGIGKVSQPESELSDKIKNDQNTAQVKPPLEEPRDHLRW